MFKKYVFFIFVFSFIIPQGISWRVWADMFPSIRELIRCESNFNAKAFNPKDTDGRPKYGILQFGKYEFYSWAGEAGLDKPDIWNPKHQIVVYRWASENGLKERWGCHKTLLDKGLAFLFY